RGARPPRLGGRYGLKLSRTQWVAGCVGVVATAIFVTALLGVLDHNRIADDAYMFVRYARNFLRSGVVAWNPGGPGTYGLTSLGYFAVVVIFQAVSRADPAVVLMAATLACGVAFVAASLFLVVRFSDARSNDARSIRVALALLLLASGSTSVAPHFVSGMDTMFTLLYCTGLLGLVLWWREDPTTKRTIACAVACGGTMAARPDAVWFGFAPLVTTAIWPLTPRHRARAIEAIALGAAVVAAVVGAGALLLGSPVPLSTFAKVVSRYGPDMDALYRDVPAAELVRFAIAWAPVVALATFSAPWPRAPRRNAVEVGVTLAIVAFACMQRFF